MLYFTCWQYARPQYLVLPHQVKHSQSHVLSLISCAVAFSVSKFQIVFTKEIVCVFLISSSNVTMALVLASTIYDMWCEFCILWILVYVTYSSMNTINTVCGYYKQSVVTINSLWLPLTQHVVMSVVTINSQWLLSTQDVVTIYTPSPLPVWHTSPDLVWKLWREHVKMNLFRSYIQNSKSLHAFVSRKDVFVILLSVVIWSIYFERCCEFFLNKDELDLVG